MFSVQNRKNFKEILTLINFLNLRVLEILNLGPSKISSEKYHTDSIKNMC